MLLSNGKNFECYLLFYDKKWIYLKSTQICDSPILDKLLNFIFHTIIKRKIFFFKRMKNYE